MLVRIFATKPDGYYFKAPSWPDGKRLDISQALEVDMDGPDLDALHEHVKGGFWLRYEAAEEAPKPEPPKAEKKKP
jgi:hypothetical protein